MRSAVLNRKAILIAVGGLIAATLVISRSYISRADVAAAPSGPVSVTLSGASSDDSVAYSIIVRNTGDSAVSNLYVAGSIPAGTTFGAATSTPQGSSFFGSGGGTAAWLVTSVASKGSVGPFVYTVSKNGVGNLNASAFVHWLSPSEGTAASSVVSPISNDERLAIEQAINNKLNTADNSLNLWSLVPGNGPRMVDFARDINLAWFAGQANNWTMALYEIDDQFPSDISKLKLRNANLAPALTGFQTAAVAPVVDAIKAKDQNAFTAAFDKMIAACNACHAAREDSNSIKIIRPTAPIIPELDFNGNPTPTTAPAAAATPTTAPAVAGTPTAGSPSSQTTGDPVAGRTLFNSKGCAACHGAGARGGIGPDLGKLTDFSTVTQTVRNGKGMMPAFDSTVVTDADLQNIIAFLKSIAAGS